MVSFNPFSVRPRFRRYGVAALVLIISGVIVVPVMSNETAAAATAQEVKLDCAADSPVLASCDFVPIAIKKNSFGANTRVSAAVDNCTSPVASSRSFGYTATVNVIALVEDGFVIDGGAMLNASFFSVGASSVGLEIKISGTREDVTTASTLNGKVQPGHFGYIVFSARRVDVSGYLRAVYKRPVNGQTEFFFPRKGAGDVHVYYPKLLEDGRPDARIWLRNVPCPPEGSPSLVSLDTAADLTAFDGFNANPQFVDEELSY